jgi:hypothetical protein
MVARWYNPAFARNLDTCYERATEGDRAEGLNWYPSAHAQAVTFADSYGVTVDAACGVIAALSPGRNWDTNLDDARIFLDEWQRGARGNRLPLVGSYGWRNVRKAAAIASGSAPLDILGGNKVRAFYACMADPSNDCHVCIDRHAKCAAVGRFLGDTVVSNAEYPILARHYLRAASRNHLLPNQYQAIIWVTWRRLKGVLEQEDLWQH